MAEKFVETKWFDLNTTASRPGDLDISYARLEWFRRKLNWGHRYLGVGQVPRQRWAVHLRKGLAEPAMVVQLRPHLIVSSYTSEFDCVVMLRFRDGLPAAFELQDGGRLLSVNTFERPPAQRSTAAPVERDIEYGGAPSSVWYNVHPLIADFIAEDLAAVHVRKQEIDEHSWNRLEVLTLAYRSKYPRRFRAGNPYLSHVPAK